ncbi:MAG: malate dehydrogenase [Dehalococcoidia bacterium]|nr:malate dehydrogenase [Dehalococcoidia bacterium]
MRSKITIIGAGNVGATCAQRLAERDYADIILIDIIEGMPQGKALDLLESGPITSNSSLITGSNSYEESANSDIVIITSGVARKPGMSRDDLIATNSKIIKDVVENVVKFSPDCVIIVVANPLDIMAQLTLKISNFPRSRVLGMSGILDTGRFKTFIAQELNVSVEDISAFVLGGHGDAMIPLPRLASVGGIPLTEMLPEESIKNIVERTVNGGAEIVSLLKTGSAFYAPSAAVAQMVDAVVLDKKKILPCAAYLDGEYDIKGVFLGVPVKLGKDGIEQIIEVNLTTEESAALKQSAEAVRTLFNDINL